MKSYTTPYYHTTGILVEEIIEGETLEQKIAKMTENNEPIKSNIGLLYAERKDGVLPGTNIRTDRWEIATEAMDKVSKSRLAKRDGHLRIEEGGSPTTDSGMAENGGVN